MTSQRLVATKFGSSRCGLGATGGGVIAVILLAAMGACGGGNKEPAQLRDPAEVLRNTELATSDRAEAVEALWQKRSAVSNREARESLKNIAWSARYPLDVRSRAVNILLADTSDGADLDTRSSLALRLPTEVSPEFLTYVCDLARERKWNEFARPAIRSWARRVPGLGDEDRPERKLVESLTGKSALLALFEVFAQPVDVAGSKPLTGPARERAEMARAAAWEILVRIDPDGEKRGPELANLSPAQLAEPLVADIVSAQRDLRTIPVTDSELRWLTELRQFAGPDSSGDGAARQQWWAEATAAVASTKAATTGTLRMRNIEPMRWAAANVPEWLRASREELLRVLGQRLESRRTYTRSGPSLTAVITTDENFSANRASVSWGDAISLLVLDVALDTPGMGRELWQQAKRDMADTSTEYGGLIETGSGAAARNFRATLFPPRPTQRSGDNRFIASDEMMRGGTWAMAHYHFHAQRLGNADYAGPGPGDAEFASEHGKNCLLFTPVAEGRMNVDFFAAGGLIIDLGVITAEGKRQ